MNRIILFFLLMPFLALTQDFKTIYPDLTAYFQPVSDSITAVYPYFTYEYPENLWIRPIQAEIVSVGDDFLVYTSFPEINTEDYHTYAWWDACYFDDLAPWIGEQVIIYEDGLNVFLNRAGDSVFIETLAAVNTEFLFYKFPDGSYFNATVVSLEGQSFLELADMVKTYELQLFNSDNEPVFSIFNGIQFKITEHYGFLNTINFRDFPDFGEDTYEAVLHELVGLSDPETGFKRLTNGDIYDYEVGDEFHEYSWADAYGSGYTRFTMKTVLSKSFPGSNSVHYEIQKFWWQYDPEGFTYGTDIQNITYAELDLYVHESLPMEVIYNYSYDTTASFYLGTTNGYNNRNKVLTSTNDYSWNNNAQCFKLPDETYNYSFGEFIEGCGSYHYYEGGYPNNVYTGSRLKYYKKGDDEWGTPFDPPTISIDENSESTKVQIVPNPASSFILLSHDHEITVIDTKIINPKGSEVLVVKTQNKKIDISTLDTGLYFVIMNTNKGVISRTLLIQ